MTNTKLLAALIAAAAISPAFAGTTSATFDFANLEWITAKNAVPAHFAGFTPAETLGSGAWDCTGHDICSSNLGTGALGGDLKYANNGIVVTATAKATVTSTTTVNHHQVTSSKTIDATVVQDHDDGYNAAKQIGAGLGVYHVTNNNSDDNITTGEALTMSFANAVTLTGFSLRSEGHNTTAWNPNATFELTVTGADNSVHVYDWKLAGQFSGLSLAGKSFAFSYGGAKADQFYLAGMTVQQATAPVPEPETYALMLAGLAAVGFVARRRQAQ